MEFVDLAKQAAYLAGDIHRKYFEQDCGAKEKGGTYDVVTRADVESEEAVVAFIRSHYPDHNFLGEEAKYQKTSSPYTWIIDPLDGTNNFAAGIPMFCVSVALAKGQDVIAGAIYDMTRDELFCARKNGGAFLNDRPIRVNTIKTLEESILITGFYYDRGKSMVENLMCVRRFFEVPVRGIRRFGAAALDLCYVACGRVPGFWEFKLHPWDFAAGQIIVEEAGGMVTNKMGDLLPLETGYVVASNGLIHEKMLMILQGSGS